MAEFDDSGIIDVDPLGGIKDFISSDSGLLTAIGLGGLFGGDISDRPSVGYQGSIPEYTAVRQAVANTFDADRRPGSGGRRYFTDVQYVPETDTAAITAAQEAAQTQAEGLEALNKTNPAFEAAPSYTYTTPMADIAAATAPASSVTTTRPLPTYGLDALTEYLGSSPYTDPYETKATSDLVAEVARLQAELDATKGMAEGGIAELSKGRYLDGKTDGMADEVPARIEGVQEARLSDGEFVIPADVVSHLGNGNSDAGAKVLEDMMARVRKARTGTTKQGKEINPKDFLPA